MLHVVSCLRHILHPHFPLERVPIYHADISLPRWSQLRIVRCILSSFSGNCAVHHSVQRAPLKKLCTCYNRIHAMEEQHSILRLSNELLKEILDYLVSDPDRVVRIDDRDSLSTDSFRRPPPEPPSSQTPQDPCTDIDHFRLVCKRFAEVSVASKFSRIVARFSTAAFNRLEELASCPHIAKHARTFTFIIRSFHVDGRLAPVTKFTPGFCPRVPSLN